MITEREELEKFLKEHSQILAGDVKFFESGDVRAFPLIESSSDRQAFRAGSSRWKKFMIYVLKPIGKKLFQFGIEVVLPILEEKLKEQIQHGVAELDRNSKNV